MTKDTTEQTMVRTEATRRWRLLLVDHGPCTGLTREQVGLALWVSWNWMREGRCITAVALEIGQQEWQQHGAEAAMRAGWQPAPDRLYEHIVSQGRWITSCIERAGWWVWDRPRHLDESTLYEDDVRLTTPIICPEHGGLL